MSVEFNQHWSQDCVKTSLAELTEPPRACLDCPLATGLPTEAVAGESGQLSQQTGCLVLERVTEGYEAIQDQIQLVEESSIDFLTGVWNRGGFMHHAGRIAIRKQFDSTPSVLLYADLDGFKAVNDSEGHAKGDEDLMKVALILSDNARPGDVAGRLGGDEFAVLLSGANATAESAGMYVQRVRNALRATGRPLTFSIGMVELTGGLGIETALVRGDKAMYEAKRLGKDGAVIIQPGGSFDHLKFLS